MRILRAFPPQPPRQNDSTWPESWTKLAYWLNEKLDRLDKSPKFITKDEVQPFYNAIHLATNGFTQAAKNRNSKEFDNLLNFLGCQNVSEFGELFTLVLAELNAGVHIPVAPLELYQLEACHPTYWAAIQNVLSKDGYFNKGGYDKLASQWRDGTIPIPPHFGRGWKLR